MHAKKILIAAVFFIFAVIATACVILATYDFNKLKPKISQAVKDATGRTLTMDGDIEIHFGFPPKIVADDLSFGNAPWGSRPEMASVKRLEIQVALLPLILGTIEFRHVIFVEPDFLLETNSSGQSNLEFNTSSKEQGTNPVLIFDYVRIESGHFTYRDGQSGEEYPVEIDRLTGEAPGYQQPIELDLDCTFRQKRFEIEGALGSIEAIIDAAKPWHVKLTARQGEATLEVKGHIKDVINFKSLVLNVTAEGQSIPQFIAVTGAPDVPDLGPFKIKARLTDPDGKLSIEGIDLEAGSRELAKVKIMGDIKDLLTLKGLKVNFMIQGDNFTNLQKLGALPFQIQKAFMVSGQIYDPAEKNYRVSDLKIFLGKNEAEGRIDVNFANQQPQLTALLSSKKTELGPFKLAFNASGPVEKLSIEKLDLNLGNEGLIAVKLNGVIKDVNSLQGVNLNFTARGKDLANLEKITRGQLPVRGAFSASGKVIIPTKRIYQLPDLKVLLGKSDIGGSLMLDLSGQKPQLTAVLSSKKIDLRGVLPPDLQKPAFVQLMRNLEPFKLAVKLIGHPKRLSVENMDFNCGTEQFIKIRLKGGINNLQNLKDVNLSFTAEGNDAANLKQLANMELPLRGNFFIASRITDPVEKNYRFSDLKMIIGENEIRGLVDINLSGSYPMIGLELSAQRFDLKPLSIPKNKWLMRVKSLPDLGMFKLTSKISFPDDTLSLEKLDFGAESRQIAQIRLNGAIKDLHSMRGMDLHFILKGSDVARLKKFTGQNLPLQGVFSVSGQVVDVAEKKYKLRELGVVLGENKLGGSLDLNLAGQRPQVNIALSSKKLDPQPLYFPHSEWLNRLKKFSDLGSINLTTKLAGSRDNFTIEELDLDLGTKEFAQIRINGTIHDLLDLRNIDLNFKAQGNDIKNLKKLMSGKLPFQGPYSFSGHLGNREEKTYKITNFEAALGDNNLDGTIELSLTGKRPRVTAELSSQKMDLRLLLAQGEKKDPSKGKPEKPAKKKKKIFSSVLLPLGALKAVDAKIKIRNKQTLLPRLALDNMNLDIMLADGALTVNPIHFVIGDGSTKGHFTLNSQGETVVIDLYTHIEQLQVGPMLDKLGYQRTIDGQLDAEIAVSGHGRSLAEVMAELNGDILLVFGSGYVSNKYLDLISATARTNLLKLINPFQQQSLNTEFNCSVYHFDIIDGLADCKFLLDSQQTSIVAVGDIDLKTEELDLKIKPSPKKGFGHSSIGKINLSLSELAKPLRLGGTLAEPSLAIAPAQIGMTFAKAIGGIALFGPLGIFAILADISPGDKNPCLTAIEKAQKAARVPDDEKQKNKKGFLRRLFRK